MKCVESSYTCLAVVAVTVVSTGDQEGNGYAERLSPGFLRFFVNRHAGGPVPWGLFPGLRIFSRCGLFPVATKSFSVSARRSTNNEPHARLELALACGAHSLHTPPQPAARSRPIAMNLEAL